MLAARAHLDTGPGRLTDRGSRGAGIVQVGVVVSVVASESAPSDEQKASWLPCA